MRRADSDRIGADAEERRMPEADLSRLPHEDVQPDSGKSGHPHERRHAEIVARGKDERENRDHHRQKSEREEALVRESTHFYTLSTIRRPNRPCGAANSTMRMTRKAKASL